MAAEFVVQPANLNATALLLIKNGTAGFTGLSDEEGKAKLIANIKRSYLDASSNVGADRVLNRESTWPCWKGVTCCYLPFTSGAGYEVIFEADAEENLLVQVVIYTALDTRDFDCLG